MRVSKVNVIIGGMCRIVLILLAVSWSWAQQPATIDTVSLSKNLKHISLKAPESVSLKYTYDPVLNKYVYTEQVGNIDIRTPIFLTPKEYEALVLREQMRLYLREKYDAVSDIDQKAESLEKRRNILPELYVNSEFFETVFGSNVIEIVPKGSFSLDLGGRYSYVDNPTIPVQNRGNFGIDFNQNINLGVTGNIGTRVKLNLQYNTQASFDFQNIFKVDYEPTEDAIIRKVELGNVSLPLSGSLIQGAQSLFGVKTQLQFGRTSITGVFSEQRTQSKRVVAQSGGALTNFEIMALDYDDNRNYFLSHFFREQYDEALKDYPFIRSKVQITRIEVWVTNRNHEYRNIRNIVALQDLAEPEASNTWLNHNAPAGFFSPTAYGLPSNEANRYDPTRIGKGSVITEEIRDVATVKRGFGTLSAQVHQGFDFAVIENARKLEEGRDFKVDRKLGYISLAQRLNDDEILAVAYQYTYRDKVYQVGEFANDGISATSFEAGSTGVNVITNNCLVLKMLKSSRVNTQQPMWNLMMKNIYSVNTLQLSPENFQMRIFYTDPSPSNYLSAVDATIFPRDLKDKLLLQVFNLDRLNKYNDPQVGGDGFFDFLDGVTVDAQYGKIIFPQAEPFGEYLFKKLGGGTYDDPTTYNANQKKYVYRELYTQTKAKAQEAADKNKFQLKGRYKSERGRGISLGAFNVPRGSVRVYAGGRLLQEGLDYTVNYQTGTVQILDPNIESSNLPIEVSVENNLIFNQQSRVFMGVNIEHKFSDKFVLGASVLNMHERPLTQKANFGLEPVNNTIVGLGGNYSTELPFLTRWANRIPTLQSDVKSNLSLRGEFAYLWAGTPKADNFNGEATSYLEDFEGTQNSVDIQSWLSWSMASVPLEFGKVKNEQLYGDTPDDGQNLVNGYGRAKLSWYTIDPIFYTSSRPSEVSVDEISKNSRRRIFLQELFPQVDVALGESLLQPTLDLAYYPQYKGPYNNNPNFSSQSSQDKWAGIMRGLSTTNFEEANIEYLQFWMLDPYTDGEFTAPGELVFNLGYISEDILKDGRKQYENGLPGATVVSHVNKTSWGVVPAAQSLAYTFDISPQNRTLQDIGLDGLNNTQERSVYTNNVAESPDDPALDNFTHYLNQSGDILQRYFNYNGQEGNSPVATGNQTRGSSINPDVEDVNKDNTMNTIDSYYEYRIPIHPSITRSDPYVNDIREVEVDAPNGSRVRARWIQYKIPLKAGQSVGGIADFRSIPFIRMYMTHFASPIVLRFGTLELLRGDWRVYSSKIDENATAVAQEDTDFKVGVVNIIENETRQPIPYVMPPGVEREITNNNNTLVRQNEQSLSLAVCDLKPKDARAVYKNVNADLRQYKFLKMFIHAEAYKNAVLGDGELVAFMRIGTDFDQNYYEIQLPLQVTPAGATSAQDIWPTDNQMEVALQALTQLKSKAIASNALSHETFYNTDLEQISSQAPYERGKNRYVIKGNPSLGNVRALMLGVRNASRQSVCGEVWFNELRLSQLENNGGWAAVGAMDANVADLMNISATGKISTVGFGSIEQTPNERSRENWQQHDVVMNVNVGKLLPSKWKIQIPLNINHSRQVATPEYDPLYQDIKLQDRLNTATSQTQKQEILEQAQDYTVRRGINLIGVKKGLSKGKKPHFYNIENLTFNYGYNELQHRDFEIESEYEQRLCLGAMYNYGFTPKYISPLKGIRFSSAQKYWQWLTDININLLPSSIMIGSDIIRDFNRQRFRDTFFADVDASFQQEIPELQQRNYRMNWQYGINYNPTKSLRLSFKATSDRIIRNYYQYDANGQIQIRRDVGLWDDLWNLGEANHFFSNFQLNYEIPLNKFPWLKFIKASYSYTGDFDWQRGSQALIDAAGEQINTIQNSGTHNLIAQMGMETLYREMKWQNSKSWAVQLLTMIKRVGANYSQTSGTVLPGFTPGVDFWGTTQPSLGFVLGSQDDVRYEAAKRGMLTTFEDLNEPFSQVNQSKLNFTANLQPLRDFQIDLSAERQYTDTYAETFEVLSPDAGQYEYRKLIGNRVGTFSISSNMLLTSFTSSQEYTSETFRRFRENRKIIAQRLAEKRGLSGSRTDTEGFPLGYGATNQAVLIPAFLSAYTGQNASNVSLDAFRNIPIPSWMIRYTGLMRWEYFRSRFRRFSLSHGYRSSYSISDFRSNLEYDPQQPDALDQGDNFRNEKLFGTVTLIEQFNPLLRVDFEMKNSVSALLELRRERTVSISLDNDYLTEILRREYRLGLGYRVRDLRFAIKWQEESVMLKSDLILKADISYRNDLTVIRNMKINDHRITAGQDSWLARLSAEYALSNHLTALYYFDYNFSKTATSVSFPFTSLRSGFTVRYAF